MMKFNSEQFTKVVVGGDASVGRTTLLNTYLEGTFIPNTKMTIGLQFFIKTITVYGNKKTIVFWDLAGVERYRNIHADFIQGAKLGLLTFDLTRDLTLSTIEQWVCIFLTHDPTLPIILLGIKVDLQDQIRVDDEYVKELMDRLVIYEYIKISSKTGENINKAFRSLYYYLFAKNHSHKAEEISENQILQWSKKNLSDYKMKPLKSVLKQTKKQNKHMVENKKISEHRLLLWLILLCLLTNLFLNILILLVLWG